MTAAKPSKASLEKAHAWVSSLKQWESIDLAEEIRLALAIDDAVRAEREAIACWIRERTSPTLTST